LEAERYGEALNIDELVSRSSKHVTEREVVVTNEPLPVMVCYTNPVLDGLRYYNWCSIGTQDNYSPPGQKRSKSKLQNDDAVQE
jgi:hypothetical protein